MVPICFKSALTHCRILLPFQQQQRPPTAWLRNKTTWTPQRRRPCHVNGDAPSPLVCNGSGGRRNIIRLPRRRPSLQHFIRPWICSGSNPDNNGQCLLRRYLKPHHEAKTVRGHWHAFLLGEIQNRPGPIQIIVAIWSRKSRILLHKTEGTSASQKTRPLYVRNSITSRGCNKGVFIGTNIPYVPPVIITSNMTRLKHIGTQTITAQPNARTES